MSLHPFHAGQEFDQTGHGRRAGAGRRPYPAAVWVWPLLALACVPDAARLGQAGRDQGGTAAVRPALDLSGNLPWPAPYDADPLWRRAATGSDFDHARLAQRESAASLLAALVQGGSLGRTALVALPYASDRREVAGRLCELMLDPVPPTSSWLLDCLHETLSGPRSEEAVDPRADALCASNLRQLAERASSSPADRDRALGALALLAKR